MGGCFWEDVPVRSYTSPCNREGWLGKFKEKNFGKQKYRSQAMGHMQWNDTRNYCWITIGGRVHQERNYIRTEKKLRHRHHLNKKGWEEIYGGKGGVGSVKKEKSFLRATTYQRQTNGGKGAENSVKESRLK